MLELMPKDNPAYNAQRCEVSIARTKIDKLQDTYEKRLADVTSQENTRNHWPIKSAL
jgi:hypothetical protein